MPLTGAQSQAFFTLNAVAAEDKLPENQVPKALNIDFSYEDDAVAVRQGTTQIGSLDFASEIDVIFRYYNSAAYGAAPWYLAEGGRIHRVTGGFGSPTATQIASGGTTDENDLPAFSAYKDHVYVASGNVAIKDNGTSTEPWVKPRPAQPLFATMTTLSPLIVVNTWTVAEGVTAQVGNTFTDTATMDTNNASFRGELRQAPSGTNLSLNGTNVIGNNGVHHIDLKFDEPKFVTRVAIDYSIGDTNYDNYFHAELDVVEVSDAVADTDTLLEEEVEIITDRATALENVALAKAEAARRLRPAKMRVSTAKGAFNTISIPNTAFEFVGKGVGNNWADIRSCRIVIETWGPVNVEARNLVIAGAENFSLHDPNIGYSYWETWASLDASGNVLSESAPSPVSTARKVVAGQGIVTSSNTSPGAWATHRILYRRGGRLLDAYAVSTNTVATMTYTDTLSDIKALLANRRMRSFIRTSVPLGVRAISPPYKDRLFVGVDNKLIWSLPGRPDTFLNDSEVTVGHTADRVQALHSIGDILIIVNRDSIYELRGSVFEGDLQDWQLRKSSAGGGSVAARCAINTPYGILTLRDEGIYFYIPGQGVEQPISWAMEYIRDLFKGNGTFDPAQQKGSRAGAGINQAALRHSVAAYKNETIYIGVPDGTATRPNRVIKLDMRRQRVSVFSYPWNIRSMWTDRDSNALLFGAATGMFIRESQGLNDIGTGGEQQGVPWNVSSRKWTVDHDTVYENLNVEFMGASCIARAVYDSTNTVAIGTLASTNRDWFNPTFNGVFGNDLQLTFEGTQTGTVRTALWNFKWDALAHPYRRKFWRTDHFANDYAGDKIWHVLFSDIEVIGTGNVTGVAYVDNTALMTQTITGPTNGRVIAQTSFPVDTFGELAYVIYTSTQDFKLWNTSYSVENEPPVITSFKTPVESLEEHLVEAVDVDVNPMGTMTSTVFVDNIAVGTYTTIGAARQSYTHKLPIDIYGRTIYTIHNGMFKHYQTWYHKREEPDRWDKYQSPDFDNNWSGEKQWHVLFSDIEAFSAGTILGTVFVDNTIVMTQTIASPTAGRTIVQQSFPVDTYGEIAYVIYNASPSTVKFKPWSVKYSAENEPAIVTSHKTPVESLEEHLVEAVDFDVDPKGTMTSTLYVDNTAVGTYTTTGTGRRSYTYAVPIDIYGRTIYTVHRGLFKHYQTWYHKREEPDRWLNYQWGPEEYGEERWLKTWICELHPFGGTVTGTLYADGAIIKTENFTGNARQSYVVGLELDALDNIRAASRVEVDYTSNTVFKHYQTQVENAPKPFDKLSWAYAYTKIGGASELDMAESFALDIESAGTATITCIWEVDSRIFDTQTLTFTGREFKDHIVPPPGMRGRLFQQKLKSTQRFRVWSAQLDVFRTGRKGVAIASVKGTPN